MPKIFNISEWGEQSWWNTGGTRDKKVYLNPEDGELYYFKQSFNKGNRNYKHEFWSEIIASEIGAFLGFNMLPYHIAIRGNVAGCISKSMNSDSEELMEGGKYLQAFDNTFKPEKTKLRSKYNLDLIVKALASFKKENHLKELYEIFVFDALIGNSDRHQENWAIINEYTVFSENLSKISRDIETGKIDLLPMWIKKIIKAVYMEKGEIRPELQTARLMPKKTRFAPIYDSGCSFGRELEDYRVILLLNDNEELNRYVDRGLSEIHWQGRKINHFDFIKNLITEDQGREYVLEVLVRVIAKFDQKQVERIVANIDKEIEELKNPHFLPKNRKELIMKLLASRINKLKEIYLKYK